MWILTFILTIFFNSVDSSGFELTVVLGL
jgi:hypothetical protein